MSTKRSIEDEISLLCIEIGGGHKFSNKLPEGLHKLNDLFPDRLYISGSYAYRTILKLPIEATSDIDVFTNLEITRCGFVEILEKIVFPDVRFKVVLPASDTSQYDLISIRKVIKIEFLSPNYPTMEFIFIDPALSPATYLKTVQATSLSECYLKLDFSEWGYHVGATKAFRETERTRRIVVNENNNANKTHIKKIADFCVDFDYRVKK